MLVGSVACDVPLCLCGCQYWVSSVENREDYDIICELKMRSVMLNLDLLFMMMTTYEHQRD